MTHLMRKRGIGQLLAFSFIAIVLSIGGDCLAENNPVKLTIYQSGKAVGSESFTVLKKDGGLEYSGQASLGQRIKFESFMVRLDENLQPIESSLRVSTGTGSQEASTTYSGGKAKNRIRIGGKSMTKEDKASPDALVIAPGTIPFFLYEILLRRIDSAQTDPQEFKAYVVGQLEIPLIVQVGKPESVEFLQGSFELKHLTATLINPQNRKVKVEIWFDEQSRLTKLSLPLLGMQVYREGFAPPAHEEPMDHTEENVTFPSDGFDLAGTLSLPKDPTGRLPAVILISGSGPQDRDENVFGIPIFAQIADRLTSQGIAVLRYDDRGVGKSDGTRATATTHDFVVDVQAAVRFLRKQPAIDSTRIGLVGHSEGALVASLAAADDPQIKLIALMAGTAFSGDRVILEQQRYALDQSDMSEEEKQKRVELQMRVYEAVKSGQGWQELEEEVPAAIRPALERAKTPWFKEFIQLDPVEALKRLQCPVLILQGGKDKQVFPHHAEAIAKTLGQRGRAPYALKVFPELNHLFQRAKTGDPSEYGELSKQVDEEFLDVLASWLKNRFNEEPTRPNDHLPFSASPRLEVP